MLDADLGQQCTKLCQAVSDWAAKIECDTLLQNKLQSELQCARRVVRVRYDDFAEPCTLYRVGRGGIILIVSDKVVRCIRQIEGLRAKLQLNPFRQSEILEDREIKMPKGRTIQAVTRRVSDRAEGRNNKS